MVKPLLLFTLIVTLVLPVGPVAAARHASIALDEFEYCDWTADARAYIYEDGSEVGTSADGGTFLDAETTEDCVAVAQNYALFHAGEACAGHEAGVAYAVVEWHVWWAWEEVEGSPIVQQYDCGDI